MVKPFRYRGKNYTSSEIESVRRLITENPGASRWALSRLLCDVWSWRHANGQPRDMVARSLMLELHRSGHIELPQKRQFPRNYLAKRQKPEPVPLLLWSRVDAPLREIRPLDIRQVRRTGEEKLFGSFIETHHYLGYTQPVGEHLKYLIYAQGTPVACMAWSSAPRHIGARDRYIGWSQDIRRRNISLVAYNTRYLILPWVKVKYLASHLLAEISRRICADWLKAYGHPVYFLETFVDPELFRGTCYRAANWVYLGMTTGRGKDDQTRKPNRSLKEVWGYPVVQDFQQRLCDL